MARGPSSISGTQKHKLGKNSRARGGRAREEGRFWDGACVGSENRGIAAPAFICSSQTMLLDIWEEGSKADVPRGPSVTATVQGGCQAGKDPCPAALLPSVRCAVAPQARAASARKGSERPCRGIGRLGGALATQGRARVRNWRDWGAEGGREEQTFF